MSERLNLVVSEDMARVIEDYRDESIADDDLPRLNKSEVARHLIRDSIKFSEDVEDIVPEHDLIAFRREQIKRENNLRDWRAGFKTRAKRQFTRRFKNGYDPDELAEFAIGMKDEARVLWHDDNNPEHVEKRHEALDYIDAIVEQAREDYATSDHDPLNVEEFFSGFSGVQEGAKDATIEESDLREKIRDYVLDLDRKGRGKTSDPSAVARKFAQEYDLDPDRVREVVDEVFDRVVFS